MLEIKEQVPLSKSSTFQVGGDAAFAAYPTTLDELREALAWAKERALPVRVLGGGSNLLVSDKGFPGLVIFYRDKTVRVDAVTGVVIAGAGAITAVVAGETVRAGLTGFEWAAGVPGTIGGAVYGNAGASGGEMKDTVVRVSVLENDELVTYANEECEFRYRHSKFKNFDAAIVGVELRLQQAENATEPLDKMKQVLKYRQDTQPKGLASSGCTFKNYELSDEEILALREKNVPENFLEARRIPSGWLIEHSNLKGVRVGSAQVSEVHGNFIVNSGNANASDILELIKLIKKTVTEKFGLVIEEEITILQ